MLHELTFKSYNGRDDIYAFINVPAAEIKGIIQIVHGFGEHSRRYLHMISKFVERGYIVTYDDHVGHGKTAIENNSWGDWGDKDYRTMVEDEYSLYKETVKLYPDLPYFMFGHSMGSIIARQFMTRYGDKLKAVTICGTMGGVDHLDDLIKQLQEKLDRGQGKEDASQMVGLLFDGFFDRIEEDIIYGNEWICHDRFVQADHAKDPFNAFTKPTNNQSILYLSQMLQEIDGEEWAKKVPVDLPVYNIAGDEDPVGQYGLVVEKVSDWLKKSGHKKVETKIYPGYRHEIFNYPDIRDQVEEGIVTFFDRALEEK